VKLGHALVTIKTIQKYVQEMVLAVIPMYVRVRQVSLEKIVTFGHAMANNMIQCLRAPHVELVPLTTRVFVNLDTMVILVTHGIAMV
jgi:hypothetical protein